ncbi:MAG TPA: hypothetical protein VM366_16965 [Anaerolineae bacterium]|nr:hypothetical protein [Anaerolineae bacterium]
MNERIAEAIKEALLEGQLPCAAAFAISERLGVEPLDVGKEADALDVRLSKCQLGLFGYGSKAEGTHRRVVPMDDVPPSLEQGIRDALDDDGNLSCAAAWRIAEGLGEGKQAVSDAAEGLDVRVVQCQLGAF